ncbi:hypothetical protein AAG906_016599 [Vitis piasezkii]
MELELKVDSRICGYRWSIDLVIVCFSTSLSSGIIDGNSLVTFSVESESHSRRRVRGRLIERFISEFEIVRLRCRRASFHTCFHSEFMAESMTLGSIRVLARSSSAQTRPPRVSLGTPFHLADHYETIPPPTVTVPPPMVPTIEDTRLAEQEAKVERLESMMRQIRLQDGGLTWDDRDGIPAASLPAKFRMPDIERYSGIGCPKIHLRLYSTVMRAHGIDDAQLVALFPMSLSGAAQRWFASVEPSRLRTWEDVAREFLTQFAFSADIDAEESISSFVTRWRAKVAGMIDRPKEQDQIDMVLRNLQPRFARRLVGIPFQDLRSLVHAAFSVEEAMARGLWTDTTPSPDSKGKKLIGPLTRSGEVGAISYQHQRPARHSVYRPPIVRAHFSLPRCRDHRIMLRSLALLRLACSCDHHIREPLLTHRLDHMHRGPRDSSLLWA